MQNVIVTGGSRGLGLAIARTLAAADYRIIALARGSTEDLTAASRAAADSRRGAIEFRACDLSEPGQNGPLVQRHRNDARTGRDAAPQDRAAQRPQANGRSDRRGPQRRVLARGWRPQRDRHDTDHRRRDYGVTQMASAS